MTLYSETTKQSYNGDGVQTDFPVTIPFFSPQDLTVYLSDPVSGEESLLEVETDYVLTGLLEGSTTVSTVVAPPGGKRLTILRRSVIRQTLDYAENDAFPAASHERALDLAAARDQELAEELGRSLRVPPTDGGALLLPPAPQRAGKVLLFDEAGDVAVTPEAYSDQMAAMADHLADAAAAAAAAEAASDQAQQFGQALKGTSGSSVAVGTGSKSFATQDDRAWSVGQRLRAASPDATKVMDGEVMAYEGGLLTLSVDYSRGNGTHNAWLLSIAGARGPAGAGDGDLMAANNLADLDDVAAARSNLGLGAVAMLSVVGNAGLADMAQATLKGRSAGAGIGAPTDLTAAQVASLLSSEVINWKGQQSFETDQNHGAVARYVGTSNGNGGPLVSYYHDSASPAANDVITTKYAFNNSSGAEIDGVWIQAQLNDAAAGVESMELKFQTRVEGAAWQDQLRMANGLRVGAPTGSFKGTGTVNAVDLYIQGESVKDALTTRLQDMSLLGELAAGSGSTLTLSSLPHCAILFVVCRSVSHGSGSSQNLRIEVSGDNGSTWHGPTDITHPVAASGILGCHSWISSVGITGSVIRCNSIAGNAQSPGNSQIVYGTIPGTTDVLVNAVRFSWSGGSFDGTGNNPTIYVHGLVRGG